MPLSVSQRRAATRQFVAEQHGRPNDKRLEGPQVRKKAPEAILMSPYNDEATLKRQAALSRVRQRRAERLVGATEAPAAPVAQMAPVVPVEEPVAAGAWLTCPEPKVPKDFARTAPAAMHWKNLEPVPPVATEEEDDVDEPLEPTGSAVSAASAGAPKATEDPSLSDGWIPPPKPAMPLMPGPASQPGEKKAEPVVQLAPASQGPLTMSAIPVVSAGKVFMGELPTRPRPKHRSCCVDLPTSGRSDTFLIPGVVVHFWASGHSRHGCHTRC
eukprot:s2555_g14.t1